jgi:hypothetical protein
LEENLINVKRVKLAGTVAIDGLPNAGDKFSQLCVVVVRDHRARCSSLRLARHGCEATQESSLAADVCCSGLAGSGRGAGATRRASRKNLCRSLSFPERGVRGTGERRSEEAAGT